MPNDAKDGGTLANSSTSGDSVQRALHVYFAAATRLVDENIRIVKYSVYCLAVVGLWRVLHSVRAFSKFGRVEDIPEDFIRKGVLLRARVKVLDSAAPRESYPASREPSPASREPSPAPREPSPAPALTASLPLLPASKLPAATAVPDLPLSGGSGDGSYGGIRTCGDTSVHEESAQPHPQPGSFSKTSEHSSNAQGPDDMGSPAGAEVAEVRITDDGCSSTSGASVAPSGGSEPLQQRQGLPRDALHELKPLYLMVEHSPILWLPQHRHDVRLLPVKLAGVEVFPSGLHRTSLLLPPPATLIKFRPLYVETDTGALVCGVGAARWGFGFRRLLNEELVMRGLAVVAPVPQQADILQRHPYSPTFTERCKQTVSMVLFGEHSALVEVPEEEQQEHLFAVPKAFVTLHLKLLKAEAYARRRQLGVWENTEVPQDLPLVVRLWRRFKRNTREHDGVNS